MIGMPTGLASGIDVLDLDVDATTGKDGRVAVDGWQNLSPVVVQTPRGGSHVWFRSQGKVGCTTGALGSGVDTRGHGGYVILPPSKPSGAGSEYRFNGTVALGLDDLPLFPESLLVRLPAAHVGAPAEELTCDVALVAAAFAVIPIDNDTSWQEWNRAGMAIWAATEGSAEGFKIFDAWSKRATRSYGGVAARWRAYSRSKPRRIGAGSICHWANAVCAGPAWRVGYDLALWAKDASVADEIESTGYSWIMLRNAEEFMRAVGST